MWNIPLKQQPQTKKGQNMSNKHERELAGKVALVTWPRTERASL